MNLLRNPFYLTVLWGIIKITCLSSIINPFLKVFFNKQKIPMLFHQDLNFVSSVLRENKCYHNCIQGVISNAYNLSKCVMIIKSTFVSGWHPSLYNHPLQRVEQFFFTLLLRFLDKNFKVWYLTLHILQ